MGLAVTHSANVLRFPGPQVWALLVVILLLWKHFETVTAKSEEVNIHCHDGLSCGVCLMWMHHLLSLM